MPPDDPLLPGDPLQPFAPIHRPGTQPADYLNELLRDPEILARTIEQAGNFAFGGVMKRIGSSVYMGWPDVGQPRQLTEAANRNVAPIEHGPDEYEVALQSLIPRMPSRKQVLEKLIANRDFAPTYQNYNYRFKSLTPAENEAMRAI